MPEMTTAASYPATGQVIPNFSMFNPNFKDSRWLTLEVCREYTRQKCSRTENECKFAHPPPHVEVQNGRVTCCFDSIKGKCQRKEPPCKYLHPPQHLREQLLQNGRNNLILRQLQAQAMVSGVIPVYPTMVYGDSQTTASKNPLATAQSTQAQQVMPQSQFSPLMHPLLVQQNQAAAMSQGLGAAPSHYFNQTIPMQGAFQTVDTGSAAATPNVPTSLVATQPASATIAAQQKVHRSDRLETNGTNGNEASFSAMAPSTINDVLPSSQYAALYSLQGNLPSGMVPLVKRQAVDNKNMNGMPMFQPSAAAAYQPAIPAMQVHQGYGPVTLAGHPSLQRY